MIITSLDRLRRKGTPMFVLQKMLESRGISLVEYNKSQVGDAFVTCSNSIPRNLPKDIKVVAYFGSERKKQNMVLESSPWDKIDYGVYISNFYKTLVSYPVRKSSVINWIGGCPADPEMLSPELSPRKIEGSINFVVCAKWWKRPFKRRRQVIKLFNDFILKQYPGSILHVLGCRISEVEENVHYYRKSHCNYAYVDIWKKSHIHIALTAFDSGPMTLNEALHYRVPFICSHNSAASDYINQLGKCGEIVKIDPDINSLRIFKKYQPFTNVKYYDKEIDYELVMESVRKIVDNFEEYTSWKWTNEFNYDVQIDKWIKAFTE